MSQEPATSTSLSAPVAMAAGAYAWGDRSSPGARNSRDECPEGGAACRDFLATCLPWLEPSANDGLSPGQSTALCTAGGTLLDIRTDRDTRLQRTSQGYAGDDWVQFLWSSAGHFEFGQEGRSCLVHPGRVMVCDPARPHWLRLSGPGRTGVLLMPRSTRSGWQGVQTPEAATVLADGAATRASLAVLTSLIAFASPDAAETAPIFLAVERMLAAALHRSGALDDVDHFRDTRMHEARRYIIEHIADPALDAESVATALHMSRRSLYVLFKENGVTPTRMIQELRLGQVLLAITDPRQSRRKLTDMAFDFGYTDYATFSRLFKRRFGRPPSSARSLPA